MRDSHCSFSRLNNGRCIAPCHYTRDHTVPGDCTGNTNRIMAPDREAPVLLGFIDGIGREIVHNEDGTWTMNRIYEPAVNSACNWGGLKSK